MTPRPLASLFDTPGDNGTSLELSWTKSIATDFRGYNIFVSDAHHKAVLNGAIGDEFFSVRPVLAALYQPEKVPGGERLPVERVAAEINRLAGEPRARFIEKASEIAAYVGREAASGDIVLIMSNGAFDAMPERILEALSS